MEASRETTVESGRMPYVKESPDLGNLESQWNAKEEEEETALCQRIAGPW